MTKFDIAAVLAAATLCATSFEANAQRMSPQPSPAHYRCTPDGKPATPGTGWCAPTNGKTTVVQNNQAANVPATVVLNQGDLDELRRQYELDKAATQPKPAVQVAAAPTGGCWTKHEMTKGQIVTLLNIGTTSANWNANMCGTPESFTKAFERVQGWSASATVTDFADNFNSMKEQDCSDAMLKNMVFVTSTGQKTGPAGKCQQDDVLLVDGNGAPVFSVKAGKVMVKKDSIIRNP